jgi:tetratricopeptide (TPR) repeat protein
MQLPELLIQGRTLRLSSRQSAIACFEQCLEEAVGNNNKVAQVASLTELALEFIETNQILAIKRAEQLLVQATEINAQVKAENNISSPSLTAHLHYAQAVIALEQQDLENCFNFLQSAYSLFESDKSPALADLSLVDDALGRYYVATNQFAQALAHFERSLTRRSQIKPSPIYLLGISHYQQGQMFLQLYDFVQAQAAFEKSLDMSLEADYTYLRLQSLVGMVQVAIAESDWDVAEALIEESLQLVEMPLDLDKLAILYQCRAEALLGNRQVLEAQDCIQIETLPRLESLQNPVRTAIAQRTMGRILQARLLEGLDRLTTETIENAEDFFVDASMIFEERGLATDYAMTLYCVADLYNVCEEFKYNRYQYQGKAVRSLKLALSALEKVVGDTSFLTKKIEDSLDRVIGNLS